MTSQWSRSVFDLDRIREIFAIEQCALRGERLADASADTPPTAA
jgi:hypothetical protein